MAKDKEPPLIPDPETVFVQDQEAQFTLRGEIRRGGMGSILLARDHEVDRDVAMKLLLGDDPIERKRFMREATLTGSLEHPNIVPIHAMGRDVESGHVFFTMKLIDGENLREILQQIKKGSYQEEEWNWTRLLQIFVNICHAMEFAHSKNVIHRDLKPSNVMVGKFGEVQVMDWGVAKSIGGVSVDDTTRRKTRKDTENQEDASGEWTADGDVIGTIAYMPPEQALGQVNKLDERSDVYSLGAILYEILCLRPPIKGKDVAERLRKVEDNEIEWPTVVAPERHVPRDLCFVVMKALSKDADDRYQSVSALREEIDRYLELRPVEAAGSSKIDIVWKFLRRHSAISIVVGIAGILLMILFFIMYVVTAHEHGIAVEQQHLAEHALDKFKKEQAEKIKLAKEKVKIDLMLERDAKREWQLLVEEEFRYNSEDDWKIVSTPGTNWEVKNGELKISGGRPHLLVYKQPIIGDIKLEFECRLEGAYLNDVSCFISSYEEDDPLAMGKNGYYIGYGCYDNKRVVLSRAGEILHSELREPLRAGVTYHVVVEHIGAEIRLQVNGHEIFRVVDKNPLSGSSRNKVGIFGYMSESYYDNIKIYKLSQSRKVDVLTLADYYMNAGRYQTALDLYENVSETAVELARLQQARAGVEKAMDFKRKQQFLERYRKQAERAFKGQPRVSLTDKGLELDASGLTVSNLGQIQGLPFNYIDMSDTDVKDITPLRSMPLRHLNISNTKVEDLEPIANSPLEYLNARGSQIDGIHFLRNKQLKFLDVERTKVRSVNAVVGMPLRVLAADGCQVDDVDMFKNMPLVEFSISGKNVISLDFLKGKKLRTLKINNTGVTDLNVVKSMPLSELAIRNTPIKDLSPVRGKDIRSLSIAGTPIRDFAILKDFSLVQLDVSYTPFSDMSLIADKNFKNLKLNYTKVSDLSMLKDKKDLRVLHFLGCPIRNLSFLRSLPDIRHLALSPHLVSTDWLSVLNSLSSLESVFGDQEDLDAHRPQSLKEFAKRAKEGAFE